MKYVHERAQLSQRIANANGLSASYVARIFGLRQPSSEGVSRDDNTYRPTLNRLEKQAFKHMTGFQKELYLVLRRAAMAGEPALTLESLYEEVGLCRAVGKRHMQSLERKGAIVRIKNARQDRPMIYRLPWIGKETAS